MFERELIILIVQIIAALGVVVSVVYLGVQINQQNKITKAQFGHSLTQRLYERYFETSTNKDYAEFLAKDWNADLIIMGRRGLTGLSEMFLGSVSNYVVHHASCSVLLIQ